jgi:hypothetical protein
MGRCYSSAKSWGSTTRTANYGVYCGARRLALKKAQVTEVS